jgi:predicted lactoylglutathione lyase
MTRQLWINLPVKDISRSTAFFRALGFSFNEAMSNATGACLLIGGTTVMLFEEKLFTQFSRHALTDTATSSEVLFSFDADSREEVDELAARVTAAGGNLFAPPGEAEGWMYACAFADPDGHRWSILHMDMQKRPIAK